MNIQQIQHSKQLPFQQQTWLSKNVSAAVEEPLREIAFQRVCNSPISL